MKRALVTGITGQDGRYLSEFLAAKGYQVFGLVKLAVLCQQLFQRYREGGSEDARFAVYETQIPAIWREAQRLVQASEHSRGT